MPKLKPDPRVSRVPPSDARYDRNAARYADTPPTEARRVVEADVDATRQRMERHAAALREPAQRFKDGEINAAEYGRAVRAWQNIHAAETRGAILGHWALARGGMAAMTPRDFGRVGSKHVKPEYERINERAKAAIADPDYVLTGGFVTHAGMYSGAALNAYEAARLIEETEAGYQFEANILNAGAEHCRPDAKRPSCAEQSAKGVVPVGELVPWGACACDWACRCQRVRFKTRAEGEAYLRGAGA